MTDGQEGYLFPSVVGDGASGAQLLRTRAHALERTDDLRLSVDDQLYFVGKLAIRQSRLAFRCLSATRGEGNDLKVLFLAGLSLLCRQPVNSFAVHGTLRSSGTLEVHGRFEGEIDHDGRLLVGAGGLCLCTVRCDVLAVAGEVRGDVRVRSRLEILATGRVAGRVSCASLVVHEGGTLTGPVRMSAPEAETASVPVPVPAQKQPLPAAGGTLIAFQGNVPARSETEAQPSAATG